MFSAGIPLVWPALCGVKHLYPDGITWRQVLITPVPLFLLPAAMLIVNEIGYRVLRLMHRGRLGDSSEQAPGKTGVE